MIVTPPQNLGAVLVQATGAEGHLAALAELVTTGKVAASEADKLKEPAQARAALEEVAQSASPRNNDAKLGVALAWLTVMCEFPGRRWLAGALVLPLALPAYVLAFVHVGLMDYSGPVQTLWRTATGLSGGFPAVRSAGGIAGVARSPG